MTSAVSSIVDWNAIDTVLVDMDGTLLDLSFDNYFWSEVVPERYARLHGLTVPVQHRERERCASAAILRLHIGTELDEQLGDRVAGGRASQVIGRGERADTDRGCAGGAAGTAPR